MPLTRISITIPEDVVEAADRAARELDRSRSWLVVEALRRYLADRARPASRVAEPVAPYRVPAAGIGEQRRAQLEADLALTPEERVKEAERTARLSDVVSPQRRVDRVLAFDAYEDYLEWDRRERLR
jgi:hypothetical protein